MAMERSFCSLCQQYYKGGMSGPISINDLVTARNLFTSNLQINREINKAYQSYLTELRSDTNCMKVLKVCSFCTQFIPSLWDDVKKAPNAVVGCCKFPKQYISNPNNGVIIQTRKNRNTTNGKENTETLPPMTYHIVANPNSISSAKEHQPIIKMKPLFDLRTQARKSSIQILKSTHRQHKNNMIRIAQQFTTEKNIGEEQSESVKINTEKTPSKNNLAILSPRARIHQYKFGRHVRQELLLPKTAPF